MDTETKKFIEGENEKLARMIAKGFTATATKDDLATLEERMDKRFDRIETRME